MTLTNPSAASSPAVPYQPADFVVLLPLSNRLAAQYTRTASTKREMDRKEGGREGERGSERAREMEDKSYACGKNTKDL
jgi:hypothetical protein